GMSISPRWEEFFAYSAFQEAVDQIAVTNANYIALIVPLRQSTAWGTDIGPDGMTPPVDVLIAGIEYVHSRCMGVLLKPHLLSGDGEWQGNIDATDRAGWFENYGEYILHYAELAEEYGVE